MRMSRVSTVRERTCPISYCRLTNYIWVPRVQIIDRLSDVNHPQVLVATAHLRSPEPFGIKLSYSLQAELHPAPEVAESEGAYKNSFK